MILVFDMDNVLTDEFGTAPRPGIHTLLGRLKAEGHTLHLWTNSNAERAKNILSEHKLTSYFTKLIYRENYDPANKGISKDIRKIKGDVLIDDDPKEISYVKGLGLKGILAPPYRKGKPLPKNDIETLYKKIQNCQGFFARIFK